MIRRHLPSAVLLAFGAANAAPLTTKEVETESSEQIEKRLSSSHPAMVYAYASRLFAEGKRDEAVKWFYVGQLRLRFHIAANPGLRRDQEPALLASLNSTVGQTINEWAGGAPNKWAAAIDDALKWDNEAENTLTSKELHATIWQGQRKGLESLRLSILARQDSIRAQRRERGLEVRE